MFAARRTATTLTPAKLGIEYCAPGICPLLTYVAPWPSTENHFPRPRRLRITGKSRLQPKNTIETVKNLLNFTHLYKTQQEQQTA